MDEREAMELCCELALKGWGRVSPNPLVGAVLLRDGTVVGTGYHHEFGGPHAEVDALAGVSDAAGCTCVVNLEPCDHKGKTGPCSKALIEAGVRRVVIGCRDPHGEASGGAARLTDAGVQVVFSDPAGVARRLNSSFFKRQIQADSPFVAVKLAMSADGYIADSSGKSRWITGEKAREWVHWLRAGFDGIAVGRRTAEIDDPSLTVRGSVTPRVPPTRYVFTRGSEVNQSLKVFTDGGATLVVEVSDGGAPGVSNEGRIRARDLESALRSIRAAGCGSLLVEGGGNLVSALLDADGVDRLYLLTAPMLLRGGVQGLPAGISRDLSDVERWTVIERRALGVDNLLVLEKD